MSRFQALRTARLTLTAVAPGELADFHALHSDPALYRHSPEAMHPDETHSASVLEGLASDWQDRGLGYWTIRDTATGSYLGCGGARLSGGTYNLYYRLHREAWGHGYATEVARAAAGCAYRMEAWAVMQAVIRPWNPESIAVATRLGMTFCGQTPDYAGVPELIYQAEAADLR